MPNDYDAAIKAKFLEYLDKEMVFIALHPYNAARSHTAVVSLIDCLRRFQLIEPAEAETLLDNADRAVLAAIETLRSRGKD